MRILVFDTETTGLPPQNQYKVTEQNVAMWPHILQMSYVLFQTENNKVVKVGDSIIKLSPEVIISEGSLKVHGISRDMSEQNGINIVHALIKFMEGVKESDIIIGHNIGFDLNMVYAEMMRNRDELIAYKPLLEAKKFYCTMKETTQFCCIESPYYGKNYNKLKAPKLIELHDKLFGEVPSLDLHNSLNDVIVTLRCYMKFKYDKDVNDTVYNQIFEGDSE